MIWLLSLVVFSVFLFMMYLVLKLLFTPKRKLEAARKQKRFLLLDYDEVIKNFELTYNGAVFTGEKYLGATQGTIDVVTISICPLNIHSLKGMKKEDFYFIEKKILEKYPAAKIHWKSPIHELLAQK